MTINIQYQQMPTSETLSKIVANKLKKLEHKYQFLIRADITFKMENDPTGNGKVCDMELSAPGPRIFARSNSDDFEKAAAETISDLEIQLRKRKGKFDKRRKAI
ncbi:hypothetical protein MTsPCn9_29240 [Croceitalea sp. MTPC9]|uniref:ribosome hibernation-promoting factor, HPF/YfiA family n=1 Tax=unclassified Croceitalea TaxID=2632280 RepID=UPI002B3EFFA8|nr:hypothetical protein MTsPCn6_30730 [Croceitalea sp. MTPC6]GMN17984.1 hypothetical protein MTsPCn9_29240 [Croceitalea sp. MTPC9]